MELLLLWIVSKLLAGTIFEGNWDMSQERVDDVIRYVIDKTAKICRKDSRILYCKDNNEINIVIVARDVCKMIT